MTREVELDFPRRVSDRGEGQEYAMEEAVVPGVMAVVERSLVDAEGDGVGTCAASVNLQKQDSRVWCS